MSFFMADHYVHNTIKPSPVHTTVYTENIAALINSITAESGQKQSRLTEMCQSRSAPRFLRCNIFFVNLASLVIHVQATDARYATSILGSTCIIFANRDNERVSAACNRFKERWTSSKKAYGKCQPCYGVSIILSIINFWTWLVGGNVQTNQEMCSFGVWDSRRSENRTAGLENFRSFPELSEIRAIDFAIFFWFLVNVILRISSTRAKPRFFCRIFEKLKL